jgi:hypothetical protein
MRQSTSVILLGILLAAVGCGPEKVQREYTGPVIEKFSGRLVRDGKPIEFPKEELVTLQMLFTKNGSMMGIPIKADGTFEIGWMPIGCYHLILERQAPEPTAQARKAVVPNEFYISRGKEVYNIEMGEAFQPDPPPQQEQQPQS